jgi:hypothetical protein
MLRVCVCVCVCCISFSAFVTALYVLNRSAKLILLLQVVLSLTSVGKNTNRLTEIDNKKVNCFEKKKASIRK